MPATKRAHEPCTVSCPESCLPATRAITISRRDSPRGQCRRLRGGRACLIYSAGASVGSADAANGDSYSSWRPPWERAVG